MPTKFSVVYDRAVFKFKDYSFLKIGDKPKEQVLKHYLLSAISDFQHSCSVDITKYDLELEQFDNELDNEMVEILAMGILYYWLSANAMNKELFKNRIHSSDYNSYSPANLLKEMREIRDSIEQEYKGKINTYSFRHGSIDTLKV